MKSVRVHQFGGPDSLVYEDLPEPRPEPGQVLVRIEAAGVNFLDIYQRRGEPPLPLPLRLGFEGAGQVVEPGAGVEGFEAGAPVAFVGVSGAYAELVAVPAEKLVRLPAGLDVKLGAAALLQGMTAHYLVHDVRPLSAGESCLVHAAAGGLGSLLVQMAKMRGARVLATVSTEEKAEVARQAGADEVILYTQQDFEQEVRLRTGGAGVTVVYDSVGKTTFDKSLRCLAPRGCMVLCGQSSGAVAPFDPEVLRARGSLFMTRPSLFHYIADRQSLEARAGDVLAWVESGRLRLRVERILPLAEAAEAHRLLEQRATAGKILLVPG